MPLKYELLLSLSFKYFLSKVRSSFQMADYFSLFGDKQLLDLCVLFKARIGNWPCKEPKQGLSRLK